MLHAQRSLRREGRLQARKSRSIEDRHYMIANRKSTSPANSLSVQGSENTTSGDSWSPKSSGDALSCTPSGGSSNLDKSCGNAERIASQPNVLPASNELMTDFLHSGLTSPQSAQRYLAHWSRTTYSEKVYTPQSSSQSGRDTLNDDPGELLNLDSEVSQYTNVMGSSWPGLLAPLSYTGTQFVSYDLPAPDDQQSISMEWQPTGEDVIEHSNIPFQSGPDYTLDNGYTSGLPWSHLSAVTGPPQSDHVLFIDDLGVRCEGPAPSAGVIQNTSLGHEEAVVLPGSGIWENYREQRTASSSGDSVDPPPVNDPIGYAHEVAPSSHSSLTLEQVQYSAKSGRRGCLKPERREHAAMMRKKHACWNCIILKYPCDGGDKCGKCRRMRSTALLYTPSPYCDRTNLAALTEIFLPSILLEQHTVENLRGFCRSRVWKWTDNLFTVAMTWGYGEPIECEVTEIIPKGKSLLYQNQYKLDPETNRYSLHKVPSPPLGIKLIDIQTWRSQLDKYLDDLLQKDFVGFPSACFRGPDCEIQRDLLHPFHDYFLQSDTKQFPGLCLKLIVITHIMTHSITLVEGTQTKVARQLRNGPNEPYGIHTCPRWLNKELKFLLSSLHKALLHGTLEWTHKLLRNMSTKKCKASWAQLFISLLTLSMVLESLQVAVRCKEDTDKSEGVVDFDDLSADSALKNIDERLDGLTKMFRQKYTMHGKQEKGFNPISKDTDREDLDDLPSKTLAVQVKALIDKHRSFLDSRAAIIGPPQNACEPQTSRLVAKFLLYF